MAVEFKDYYRILGVDRTADDKTIKSAYRKLARKHHPDVAKGKDGGDRFREINEAYEVLSDPEKRRRYDTLGPDWQRYASTAPPGAQPGGGRSRVHGDGGDFSDFFRTIFGDLGARGSRRRRSDRHRGLARRLHGRRPPADGPGRAGRRRRSRSRRRTAAPARRFEFEVEEPCPTCHGAGNVGGKPCATCHGGGWQSGGATTST